MHSERGKDQGRYNEASDFTFVSYASMACWKGHAAAGKQTVLTQSGIHIFLLTGFPLLLKNKINLWKVLNSFCEYILNHLLSNIHVAISLAFLESLSKCPFPDDGDPTVSI